ncbi:MAG: radical SAM family heme chaperone HemW [Chloroflexi bacterium]|nr:radical SAM family heme chaperone HemW [Chloroflexota bacterium]
MTPEPSIYLHIPFCTHRCAYCDFNTYAGQESAMGVFVNALIKEIEVVSSLAPEAIQVQTIFFGGGTPSILSAPQIVSILQSLRAAFSVSMDAEVTMEANPGTITPESLSAIRQAGINRISIGAQSANTEELRMLEREHDFFDVIEAVSSAKKAGIRNVNLDLMYGLPGQALATWQTTLKRVVDLNPTHISAYALTLEHGTPFGRWSSKGLLPLPDPDLAAEMYEYTMDFLAKHGYFHYEISNWARAGYECRHNLQYWRSLPYLAFGAGAHGYFGNLRYSNVLRIKTYIDRLLGHDRVEKKRDFPLSPAVVSSTRQTHAEEISDFMITNLRLVEPGVLDREFRLRFGIGVMEKFPLEIEELIAAGLMERASLDDTQSFRLSARGRLLGNQVFMKFI